MIKPQHIIISPATPWIVGRLKSDYEFHAEEHRMMAEIAFMFDMQMALTYLPATVANNMLNQIIGASAANGGFLSLHNSTGPSTTGANEVAANSASGYTQATRPSIAWGANSNGVTTSNTTQTYTMGASWATGAIGYFGIWGASSAGTYYGGGTTTGLGSVAAGATITITSAVTLTVAG
jgi:hypothetical protein